MCHSPGRAEKIILHNIVLRGGQKEASYGDNAEEKGFADFSAAISGAKKFVSAP